MSSLAGSMNYPKLHMLIDGEQVAPGRRRTHDVLNPATGEVLGQLPLADPTDLDRALDAAKRGFQIWRNATPQQRATVLSGGAPLMLELQEQIARIATLEEGKTLAEARTEVLMVVGLFNFYAGECLRDYGRVLARPAGLRSTVTYEPVGPVGQVCVSPTRFMVHENIFRQFTDGFAERARALRVGDGLDESSQMGPLANPRRPEAMDRLIEGAVTAGATCHVGGASHRGSRFLLRAYGLIGDSTAAGYHERRALRPRGVDQPLREGSGHDCRGQSSALRAGGPCVEQ